MDALAVDHGKRNPTLPVKLSLAGRRLLVFLDIIDLDDNVAILKKLLGLVAIRAPAGDIEIDTIYTLLLALAAGEIFLYLVGLGGIFGMTGVAVMVNPIEGRIKTGGQAKKEREAKKSACY